MSTTRDSVRERAVEFSAGVFLEATPWRNDTDFLRLTFSTGFSSVTYAFAVSLRQARSPLARYSA